MVSALYTLLGFTPLDIIVITSISLSICILVCTLAMEAPVIFTPAFLVLFPLILGQETFPKLQVNEAIGLSFIVGIFGYSSSVIGYWLRKKIDFSIVKSAVIITIPFALALRVVSYYLESQMLVIVFGFILISLAIIIMMAHRKQQQQQQQQDDKMQEDNKDIQQKATTSTTTRFRSPQGFLVFASGGALAGFIGIAIGEIVNTYLIVRKLIPIKKTTGTSALVLHMTIATALTLNLIIVFLIPFDYIPAKNIKIPWNVALIIAPVVVVGGQIGSYINSKLAPTILVQILIIVYASVGIFVLYASLTGILV